jgi:hypothetical protein
VQSKAEMGFWKSCEQTLPQHRHGARTNFFGWLGDEQLGCGLLLLKSDFGVGVNVFVERVEFWMVALDRPLDGAL